MNAEALIAHLGLVRLGFEGGYYRELSRSDVTLPTSVLGADFDGPRAMATHIYYMLTPHTRGLMHRLRGEEIYHFYLGDPVRLLLLAPDGHGEQLTLGHDLAAGQRLQVRVPAGWWQGSRVVEGGTFGLMGTTMAPGFDLKDFELGERSALTASHPAWADAIADLTPARVRTDRWELTAATLDLLHAELHGPERLAAGLGAKQPKAWPPPGDRGPEPSIERASPDRRGWDRWYVVDRSHRRVVGVAGFDGPPEDGRVGLAEPRWTEIPDAAGQRDLIRGLCRQPGVVEVTGGAGVIAHLESMGASRSASGWRLDPG